MNFTRRLHNGYIRSSLIFSVYMNGYLWMQAFCVSYQLLILVRCKILCSKINSAFDITNFYLTISYMEKFMLRFETSIFNFVFYA